MRRRIRPRWVFATPGLVLGAFLVYARWPVPSLPLVTVVQETGNRHSVPWPLMFSPDGRKVLVSTEGGVTWNDSRTGRREADWSFLAGAYALESLQSLDGRSLVVELSHPVGPVLGGWGNSVAILHAETLQERFVFRVPGGVWCPRVSADGQTLTFLFLEENRLNPLVLAAYRLEDGTEQSRKVLPVGKVQFLALALSPDDRTLATVDVAEPGKSTVTLRDASTGTVRSVLPGIAGPGDEVTRLKFSPDNATLAVGRSDGRVELWSVASARQAPVTLRNSRGYQTGAIAFSPDGRWIAAEDGFPWASPSGRNVWDEVTTRVRTRNQASILPEVVVWDVRSGKILAVVPDEVTPAFSNDGRLLATSGLIDYKTKVWALPPR